MNLIFLSRKTKIQIKRKQGTAGNNCKKYKIHERLSFKYKYTHQNKHKNMKTKSTMSLEDMQIRANKHGETLCLMAISKV